VYWKHFFEWGPDLQNKIKAIINARKIADITSGSEIDLQENAKNLGVYAARVVGRKGELYVRIGGSDQQWQPSASGYSDYREYAQGAGWKVWVKLPGNPQVAHISAHGTVLPVPEYQPAGKITPPPE